MTPTRRLTAALAALIVAFTMLLVLPAHHSASATVAAAQMGDKDCGDFPNQAAAQRYYVSRGGPQSDPDGLDADGDGVACESNPCPCSSSTSSPGPGPQPAPEPSRPPLLKQFGNVTRVIDGDTVEVRLKSGRKESIRFLGIDTPEVYGGKECGGPEASQSMKKLLPVGSSVKLLSDRSQDVKDRYGRLLRYVFKGGKDIGLVQLQIGSAAVYVYGGKPVAKINQYRQAEAKAKRQRLGMWGSCS
ncbi:MAG: thermonuclease family protein [Nocardioides sp.]